MIGVPLLIISAILQSTLLPRFPIMGLIPNLILLVVVAWSYLRGANRGLVWALVGGLALDLASGAPFGITPLPLLIASLIAGMGARRGIRSSIILSVGLIVMATLVYQIVYLLLLVFTGHSIEWLSATRVASLLVIIHIMIFPVVFVFLAWLSRTMYHQTDNRQY